MIRISKLADYAVVLLSEMAKDEAALHQTSALSVNLFLPEPTVAKTLKLLVRGGVVNSVRGVNGGYRLARGAGDISIADIVVAIDGPIALTACTEDDGAIDCLIQGQCSVRGRWDSVNTALRASLEGISLLDMMDDNCFKKGRVA